MNSKRYNVLLAIFIAIGALGIFSFILVNSTVRASYDDVAIPYENSYAPPLLPAIEEQQASSTAAVATTTTAKAAIAAPAKKPAPIPIQLTNPEYPARLQIPSLSIDAKVQETGVTARGTLGTPTNFTDVAWYSYGTIPGQAGSAIIDGHVDNGLGLAGVFKHLDSIKQGDDIYVQQQNGTKLHFVVSGIALYNYKSTPTDQIFNQDDGTYLKLITCEGSWVQTDRTYDTRIVVTATLVK